MIYLRKRIHRNFHISDEIMIYNCFDINKHTTSELISFNYFANCFPKSINTLSITFNRLHLPVSTSESPSSMSSRIESGNVSLVLTLVYMLAGRSCVSFPPSDHSETCGYDVHNDVLHSFLQIYSNTNRMIY